MARCECGTVATAHRKRALTEADASIPKFAECVVSYTAADASSHRDQKGPRPIRLRVEVRDGCVAELKVVGPHNLVTATATVMLTKKARPGHRPG